MILYDPDTDEWIVDGRRISSRVLALRRPWDPPVDEDAHTVSDDEADAREARRLMGVE
jgi:hypothetical protein